MTRLRAFALLLTITASACASQSDAAKHALAECSPIRGVEEIAGSDALILFGEMHGTSESPRIFGDVVCAVARRAKRAVVGLEISHTEQAAIDAFLAGGEGARAAMLAGPHWTREYQDGRSSVAMLELFDRLRALRETGLAIDVVAFDPLPDNPDEREANLAKRLAGARAKYPDRAILVLTGNLHPWTREGTPWDPKFLPMGRRLVASGVIVVPIELRFGRGRAWTCSGATPDTCGVADIPAGTREGAPELELFPEPDERGYRGAIFVGPISASPPALATSAGTGLPVPGRPDPKSP